LDFSPVFLTYGLILFSTVLLTINLIAKSYIKGLLTIIYLWWFLFLIIAASTFFGNFAISFHTILLYVVFFLMLQISVVLCNSFDFFKSSNKRKTLVSSSLYRYVSVITIFFVAPIVIFLFFRFLYILRTGISNTWLYRSDVFGLAGRESILFVTNLNAFIYANTIAPLLFFILIFGTLFYILRGKYLLLICSYILIALDTAMMMGRFGFYYIFFSLLFIAIFNYKRFFIRKNSILRNSIMIFLGLNILLIPLIVLSIYRSGSVEDFKKKVLGADIINYHIASIGILNLELNNPKSIIHVRSYGRSTLGSVERLMLIGLSHLGIKGTPQGDLNGEYLHENRLIGYTREGRPMHYNAFGSIFFSMYRDGGIPFISICGIMFGLFLNYFSGLFKKGNMFAGVILMHLFFILIFGIFQPFTSGPISISLLLTCAIFPLARIKLS
jgi:oligosaccharide repeat unit polymerase